MMQPPAPFGRANPAAFTQPAPVMRDYSTGRAVAAPWQGGASHVLPAANALIRPMPAEGHARSLKAPAEAHAPAWHHAQVSVAAIPPRHAARGGYHQLGAEQLVARQQPPQGVAKSPAPASLDMTVKKPLQLGRPVPRGEERGATQQGGGGNARTALVGVQPAGVPVAAAVERAGQAAAHPKATAGKASAIAVPVAVETQASQGSRSATSSKASVPVAVEAVSVPRRAVPVPVDVEAVAKPQPCPMEALDTMPMTPVAASSMQASELASLPTQLYSSPQAPGNTASSTPQSSPVKRKEVQYGIVTFVRGSPGGASAADDDESRAGAGEGDCLSGLGNLRNGAARLEADADAGADLPAATNANRTREESAASDGTYGSTMSVGPQASDGSAWAKSTMSVGPQASDGSAWAKSTASVGPQASDGSFGSQRLDSVATETVQRVRSTLDTLEESPRSQRSHNNAADAFQATQEVRPMSQEAKQEEANIRSEDASAAAVQGHASLEFDFEVPQCGAGATLSVTAPDGVLVKFTLPDYIHPGDQLFFAKDSTGEWAVSQCIRNVNGSNTAAEQGGSSSSSASPDWLPEAALQAELEDPSVVIVEFMTTKGPILLKVAPKWSPIGAARFLELVEDGFYSDIAIYRAIARGLVQFGIVQAQDPRRQLYQAIQDDPLIGIPFLDGIVSFASAGSGTRTSTLCLFLADFRDQLGRKQPETPIGRVCPESMETLHSLYTGYGDIPQCGGQGPDPGLLEEQGNHYIHAQFPKCDFIVSARTLT
eukprot:TRINITY_DN81442_c0_g1_i1.p1 TRINITY_DN81442_c0_g1~~TRINITY_DN81442_c0_g1_i1.p1  ORF type:complete len:771 (+),score=149.01 TRINITY_DN81442_c0_g1_i1:91-2403(+)